MRADGRKLRSPGLSFRSTYVIADGLGNGCVVQPNGSLIAILVFRLVPGLGVSSWGRTLDWADAVRVNLTGVVEVTFVILARALPGPPPGYVRHIFFRLENHLSWPSNERNRDPVSAFAIYR